MDQGPEEKLQQIKQMEKNDLKIEELRVNITRPANWESLGPDRLPKFWIN